MANKSEVQRYRDLYEEQLKISQESCSYMKSLEKVIIMLSIKVCEQEGRYGI